MMRALWTAASGMTSQQLNVDTISNNLSNVNTTGYKKEKAEFESLLYQTLKRADQDPANGPARPVNLQVGLGVKPVSTARVFQQGNIQATENIFDFAIDGPGFFMVQMSADDEDIAYTRDGSFKLSTDEDGEAMLVTSAGYPVLDIDGDTITFDPEDVNIQSILVDDEGNFTYLDDEGEIEDLDIQIGIVQFPNTQGLEAIGGNLFRTTPASGEAMVEAEEDLPNTSTVRQKYLEMSNVSVAEEMIDLIVAQRAYELNSKAIQTADDMLQNANNLKR